MTIVATIVAGLVGLGLYLQEQGDFAWFAAPIMAAAYATITFAKLLSDTPVGDGADHVRFTLMIAPPIIAGPVLLIFGGFQWARPLGLLLLPLGALFIAAEVRDLRRWRAAVRHDGGSADRLDDGKDGPPGQRAW